jgi:SH3 domain protein
MKKLIFILIFAIAGTVHAQTGTRYVTDSFEINIRSGPGTQYRIIRMINSGQKLELLETQENWSKVQLPGGVEGWVFTSYLQSDPPAKMRLQAVSARLDPLEKEHRVLKEEKDRLVIHNSELAMQLEETLKQLEASMLAYERLNEDSSEFLSIKTEHEHLAAGLAEKNKVIEELEKKIGELVFSSAIKWFLAGAGVLLLGMLIGNRAKKKRSTGLR